MAAAFAAAGAETVPFGEPADVVVVNTCTVTGKAEQKARRELRSAAASWPEAAIIVTGCYAELEPDALAALSPRTVVVPGSRKGDLPAMASALVEAHAAGLDPVEEARRLATLASGRRPDPFAFLPGDFRFRARASLKVQDGCDNRCAYCRVCLARGASVSLDPAEVLRRALALRSGGYPEIVLTGVNLSQYRWRDLDFPGLLELLCRETDGVAYRISSWEPDRVDDAFLRAFSHTRVRPHLHLAAQSGSDGVLAAMGRRYGRDAILRAVAGSRSAKADPFIGMDLILGFPGEGDDDFSATLDLVRAAEPAWVHAFTFSPRPGTPAFGMKPKVPERIAVERAAVIGSLAREGKAAFAARRLGRALEAVPEGPGGDGATAVSAEYLKLRVRGLPSGHSGSIRCRVTGIPAGSRPGGDGIDLDADFLP